MLPLKAARPRGGLSQSLALLALICLVMLLGQFMVLYYLPAQQLQAQQQSESRRTLGMIPEQSYVDKAVLISYGYYEKDDIQLRNFEFFLLAGTQQAQQGPPMHWSYVISSETCTPCKAITKPNTRFQQGPTDIGVKRVAEIDTRFTLIYRTENEGMDIASHNVTFEYFKQAGRLWSFAYFFLINSSVKGPFYPSYMPPGWHWTHAYLVRFRGDIHAVSSSLVCLPDFDAGGPGPRLESWALAVDALGLQAMIDAGALFVRRCKICKGDDGIIVAGEYGIGSALLERNYNMATLMSKYAEDLDWRDSSHWNCNNNVHPSRHGTYDGIAFHPYETIFVKSSWHVADPYTEHYTKWRGQQLQGAAGTEGAFDYMLYRFAISGAAQEPNALSDAYNVSERIDHWRGTPQYHWF